MNSFKRSVEPISFWPSFICISLFISCGIFFTEGFGNFLNNSLDVISQNFGWLFMLAGIFAFALCLFFVLSRYGDMKFGGQDAKPELGNWQWFTICLCSGIGTGILFWGMGEPMFFYAEPAQATGYAPFSRDAGVNAISQATFHWTIIQYSFYTLGALAVAFVAYNKNVGFAVSSSLYGLIGEKHKGWIGKLVNGLCIFTLCGAVASSMGAALLQIGSGLNNLFGFETGPTLWLFIAIAITATYVLSSISGMKSGLTKISSLNTFIFIGMALFMLIFGPTRFILDIGVASLGDLANTFFDKASITNALTEDEWAKNWTVQYWASMVVVAPLIGLFYARLAKGRTVREFVSVTILGPSIFGFIWISIFGGTAIDLQSTGKFDMWQSIQQNGMENTVFAIFNNMPLSSLFIGVFLFAVFTSIVTYADPMTSVLSNLSSKSSKVDEEPPRVMKLIWGISIGTIAYLIIATGGIDGIRGMFTLIGFPMMFLLFFIGVAAVKSARAMYIEQFGEQRKPTLVVAED